MRPTQLLPLLLAAVLAGGRAAWAQDEGSGARRPNIVVILADDLGWKDVSHAGSAYPTPNIDRLARQGVVFTQASAAAPTCSPTRAALLTGRSPASLGITRAITIPDYSSEGRERGVPRKWPFLPYPNAVRLPEGVPTFADVLRAGGYETVFIGKWHVGRIEDGPEQHGFEYSSFVGATGATTYFPPYPLKKTGRTRPGTYLTDRLTDEALLYLRREHERPFCLFLSHFAVHAPLTAPEDDVAAMERRLDADSPQGNAVYGAMIRRLDEGVGRVMDALVEHGLAGNTIVVFTSDNGPSVEHKGQHLTTTDPLRGGKLELYEGGLRVPFVVRWPGVAPAGERRDAPIVSMDLFPTLVHAAGLEVPEDAGVEGADLAPLLRGDVERVHDELFFYVPHRDAQAAVRAGDWKLLHRFRTGSELYDLAADPGETHDLAASEPERAAVLRERLLEWIRGTGSSLPEPNPGFDPERFNAAADDED